MSQRKDADANIRTKNILSPSPGTIVLAICCDGRTSTNSNDRLLMTDDIQCHKTVYNDNDN